MKHAKTNDLSVGSGRVPQKRGWPKLVLALVLFLFVSFSLFVASLIVEYKVPADPVMQFGIAELSAGGIAMLAVLLLGGWRWLSPRGANMSYAFRMGWVFLLVGVVAIVTSIVGCLVDGTVVTDGALMRLASVVVLCLGIGIYEECLFRGLLFGGLLAVAGKSRKGVMFAVIASSLVFGYWHVIGSDFSDPMMALQGVLKVVQTGMFGVVMCAVMLHTRRLGGAIILHALNDFLIMVVEAVVVGTAVDTEYVVGGSDAIAVVIVYAIMIAITLYPTIRSLRSIWREQSWNRGPFVKDDAPASLTKRPTWTDVSGGGAGTESGAIAAAR